MGLVWSLFVGVDDFRFKRVLPLVDARIVPVCFVRDRQTAVTCCCVNCDEGNVCCSACSFKKYFNMV